MTNQHAHFTSEPTKDGDVKLTASTVSGFTVHEFLLGEADARALAESLVDSVDKADITLESLQAEYQVVINIEASVTVDGHELLDDIGLTSEELLTVYEGGIPSSVQRKLEDHYSARNAASVTVDGKTDDWPNVTDVGMEVY